MPSSPPSARGALTSARWFPFVILGIGLTAISFGAILARIAQAEGIAQGFDNPGLSAAMRQLALNILSRRDINDRKANS